MKLLGKHILIINSIIITKDIIIENIEQYTIFYLFVITFSIFDDEIKLYNIVSA